MSNVIRPILTISGQLKHDFLLKKNMNNRNSFQIAAVATVAIMMVGCQKAAEQPIQGAPAATSTEAKIPEKDRIDNTAEVEAIASKAKPTQAQVDQYNKDEAEMIDKSRGNSSTVKE